MKHEFDLVCIGTALVDSLVKGFNPEPVSASGYLAESGMLAVGGEAVNAAIAAVKLGLKTAVVCALGDDDAGTLIRSALQKQGVDTHYTVHSPRTPVTTLFVRADGTRKSIMNEAHRYNFHPEKTTGQLPDARAVLLGSLFRPPFDDPEIIHTVVRSAGEAGQLVVADTKLPNFRPMMLDDIRDSLPMMDYITPNEDEARYFTGKSSPEDMADVFLSRGVRNVIIKLGAAGCLLKSAVRTVRLPAFRTDAVDSTGAGDSFAAGFVSEILRGKTQEEALVFASACGALCVSAVGAGTALQSREQVLEFIRKA